jgi:SAM-dependent methyltransferase
MNEKRDMSALSARTQQVYERKAARYDAERSKALHERTWLSRFEELLPAKATLLDAGCGAGEPIAQYLIGHGHTLTGIDYAPSMIRLAKGRFPGNRWLVADMRRLDLGEQFDGIIAWHSFFHLSPEEQRHTLVRFAGHLKPGGALMATVGTAEGEVIGRVGGEEVYHGSLSPGEYRQILHHQGLDVVNFVFEDPECELATVLLAQKRKNEKGV